jgi:hypothetical protein
VRGPQTELMEWTCEGAPKAADPRQVGGNGDPARYQADTHQQVRDKAGFAGKANLGGTAGIMILSLLLKGQVFLFAAVNPAPRR